MFKYVPVSWSKKFPSPSSRSEVLRSIDPRRHKTKENRKCKNKREKVVWEEEKHHQPSRNEIRNSSMVVKIVAGGFYYTKFGSNPVCQLLLYPIFDPDHVSLFTGFLPIYSSLYFIPTSLILYYSLFLFNVVCLSPPLPIRISSPFYSLLCLYLYFLLLLPSPPLPPSISSLYSFLYILLYLHFHLNLFRHVLTCW